MHINVFNLVYANKTSSEDFVSELFALNFIIIYYKFRYYLNKNCASKFHNMCVTFHYNITIAL